MSAFIIIPYAECIQIMTDGAAYDTQGIIHRVMEKCWSSDALPVAITGRGNMVMVEGIAKRAIAFCEMHGTTDAAIGYLEGVARGAARRGGDIEAQGSHFEIAVAGYSETFGFFQKIMVTNALSGSEPFSLIDVEGPLVGAPDIHPSQVRHIDMATMMTDPAFLRSTAST